MRTTADSSSLSSTRSHQHDETIPSVGPEEEKVAAILLYNPVDAGWVADAADWQTLAIGHASCLHLKTQHRELLSDFISLLCALHHAITRSDSPVVNLGFVGPARVSLFHPPQVAAVTCLRTRRVIVRGLK